MGENFNKQRTYITEDIINIIADKLRHGAYITIAARAAGISYRTYYNWRKLGESDDPKHAIYKRFLEEIEKAEAEGEVRLGEIVMEAAEDGDWRAAIEMLERKYPERWSKKNFTDITTAGKSINKIEISKLSDEELEIIEKLLDTSDGKTSDSSGSTDGESEA